MSARKEIVGLQFLRGFAALGVLIDHAQGMASFPKYFGREVLDGSLGAGGAGVHIFFVISGFIITIVCLSKDDFEPRISIQLFFKKRFVRIVPVMWVSILAFAAVRVLVAPIDEYFPAYLRAFFLVPVGDVEPSQIWTLRHEAIFYILFAISFLGPRALRPLLLAWFLLPLLLGCLEMVVGYRPPNNSFVAIFAYFVNLEFGLGFLLGLVYLRGWLPLERRVPIHSFLLVALFCALAMYFGAMTRKADWGLVGTLFTVSIFAVPVALSIMLHCKDDMLSRFGELMGNASYSVYLFHSIYEPATLFVLARFWREMPVGLAIAITVLIALFGGILAHLIVERPLVRVVQRWLVDRPVRLPVSVR